MINFFRRIPVYIKIYPDRVEITNIRSGETISKISNSKFSSDRMLVAEFSAAGILIRSILKELRLSTRSLKILIQQMKEFEGGMCESEKRLLRDLAEQAGGVVIFIVTRTTILSNEEMDEFLKINQL